MKKGFPFLFLLLVFLNSCNTKTADKNTSSTNDSIQKYLDLAGNETLAFEKRIKYNDKALSLIDFGKNDSLTRNNIHKMNINLGKLENAPSLEKFSKILIEKSIEANDSISLARGFYILGYSYMSQSKNVLAIEYYFKAKKIFLLKGHIEEKVKAMRNIAITQYYANDFLGSIKTSFSVINESKKNNFRKEINNAYLNIGNNLSCLKDDKAAIDYYKKINYEDNELTQNCSLNNNIATSYIELGEYEKAFIYLKKNLNNKNFEEFKPRNIGVTYSLLGFYYLKKKNFKKSFLFLKKADVVIKSKKILNGENYNHLYLSKYYESLNSIQKSIRHAEIAVSLSKEYKNINDLLTCLTQLIRVDKTNASKYAEQYIKMNDSLQIAERNFRDKFARIAFETNEITQQKNTAIKQRSIIITIALTLLFIAVLIFIIARQRLKQKELTLLQTQQNANEEIYQLMLYQKNKEEEARYVEKHRIGLELHDGVMNKLASTRLHLSILTINRDDNTIEKCLTYINDIQNIEKEIRNIAHDLNQDVFDQIDSFGKLLEDFVEEQNKISKTKFKLEIDESINWDMIPIIIKINFYRIIQEASQNINKHAKAKNAIISFLIDQENICLSIIDNGIGIDSSETEKGIGFQNMEHRVKILKGKLNIHSKPNSGTSINIAIPLPNSFFTSA